MPEKDHLPAEEPARGLLVRVGGRVQGVWFRASTRDEARRLGLAGWVRNLPDGDVEARFEGPPDALARMLAWCRRGPPGARVDRVDATWEAPSGQHRDFVVRS